MIFLLLSVTLNALICTVSCHYSTSTTKINCDEPFQFCSNNRPSNEPTSCERNGGYPDDLNFDASTTSDYSQYRAAIALKPCFNKEMEELGFDDNEQFRTIDVFTENNFRLKTNIGYRLKRQALQNNNLGGTNNNRNAISVVFEEPGSRMALIDYLNNPDIPERSCFNDSYHLSGKELYQRLCFPKTNKKYGSVSSLDEKSFDQCTYDSERSSGVQRRYLQDAANLNERQLTPKEKIAPKKRSSTFSIVDNPLARIVKHFFGRTDNKNSQYKNSIPTSIAQDYTQVKYPPRPPPQRYGVRVRQRRDFPCNDPSFPQYMRLCENLKKDGRVVKCGNRRFSKCDSEWTDCIEEDEKYLREETDYYKDSYGDTCPIYSPGSQDDPYPGQPFVQNNQQKQTYHQYNEYNTYQQYKYQHANRRQEVVKSTEPHCRGLTAEDKGDRVRCDTNLEISNADYQTARDVPVEEVDPCQDGTSTSKFCSLADDA